MSSFDARPKIYTPSEIKSHYEEFCQSVKKRYAFIYCGSKSEFCINSAIEFSRILKEYCNFNCKIIVNQSSLINEFEIYLDDSFKDVSYLDFIFYYIGESQYNKNKNNNNNNNNNNNSIEFIIENANREQCSFNKIIDLIDKKEKDLQSSLLKHECYITFRKLYILDLNTSNDGINPIESLSSLFKNQQQQEFYRPKMGFNSGILYSPIIGDHSVRVSNQIELSSFTSILIERITSKSSPGRRLLDVAGIMANELFEKFIETHCTNIHIYQELNNLFKVDLDMESNLKNKFEILFLSSAQIASFIFVEKKLN
ncbi:hypothetical protein ACTFIZ_011038 [Dictyostelium cf. discoideum]